MTVPSTADSEAARLLLARLGVSPADLLAAVEDWVLALVCPDIKARLSLGCR
ncbi:MAG: hypothetical protein ACRDSR_08340 [Pseudonocardiaceae bacterium]